ncbi:hypothetical protein F0726_00126 [Acidithiobacillus caldus]|nr:hypothetical protein F0726_00126 [Acidithiobacillus caldus]
MYKSAIFDPTGYTGYTHNLLILFVRFCPKTCNQLAEKRDPYNKKFFKIEDENHSLS